MTQDTVQFEQPAMLGETPITTDLPAKEEVKPAETEAVEQIEQPQAEAQSTEGQPTLDAKFEKEEWAKKRLARQEARHRREMQELAQSLQAQFLTAVQELQRPQGTPAQQPAQFGGAYTQPATQAHGATDVSAEVQREFLKRDMQQQALEEQKKTEAFRAQEERLNEKYDDYYDVASEVRPYLTKDMAVALRELPEASLENFYLAWKENPEQIKRINQLSPVKQALEMARLDALYAAKNLKQSSESIKPESQKVISPIKPTGAIKRNNWLEQSFADMVADYKQQTR